VDKFVIIVGIIGLILLAVSLVIIIYAFIDLIKKRTSPKKFISSCLLFVILFAFGLAFTNLALFLQTFNRYTYEERIGWIYTEKSGENIVVTFVNEKKNNIHFFKLTGEQWMVEGYFLRWSLWLRWLGAGAYYRVTRFSGRNMEPEKPSSAYQIEPEKAIWKFLLKYGEKLPFIDAAYGIGAFQYPKSDTFFLYINDTGFILRTH
jgi:hypothetical protein